MKDYLYHYTNLDTLALILKNRTFRLSPLSNMDDKQEQMTQESIDLGKYIFVSCWTKAKTESIPMWSMYTSRDSGVRIKLKEAFFKEYPIDKEKVQELYPDIEVSGDESNLKALFTIEKLTKQPFYCTPFKSEQLLVPITYTSDSSLLQPKIIQEFRGGLQIEFDRLGKFKNKAWQFQEEWRYRMTLMPFSAEEAFLKPEQLSNAVLQRIVSESYAIPTFIDLDIDDEAFNELEVTISPFMTAGNRCIVNDLIEKYCSSATVNESELDKLV